MIGSLGKDGKTKCEQLQTEMSQQLLDGFLHSGDTIKSCCIGLNGSYSDPEFYT